MPDSPTHPEYLSGEQRFRADLVAYLDSLPVGDLAALLCELPVMTRITLMHELSDRGPAWPDCRSPGRSTPTPSTWTAARCGRSSRTGAPPAPPAAPAHRYRWATRAATDG
jgi:hypothetical protein